MLLVVYTPRSKTYLLASIFGSIKPYLQKDLQPLWKLKLFTLTPPFPFTPITSPTSSLAPQSGTLTKTDEPALGHHHPKSIPYIRVLFGRRQSLGWTRAEGHVPTVTVAHEVFSRP